jgi:hypothetical protein
MGEGEWEEGQGLERILGAGVEGTKTHLSHTHIHKHTCAHARQHSEILLQKGRKEGGKGR